MHDGYVDALLRLITTSGAPRRVAVGGLAALLSRLGPEDLGARKKRKKRKKKRPKFNDFGCVNVGKYCKRDSQCCSGICKGKKSRKKCKAHDTGGCQAGQVEEFCGGVDIRCTSSSGDPLGACDTTTGNAAYCAGAGNCFPCAKDADCRQFCGPAAACVVCAGFCADTTGTACVGPSECTFPPS